MASLRVMGWRFVRGLCLLLMVLSAAVLMLVWGFLDGTAAAAFRMAPGIFLVCGIGLLFAFVFERSRTPRATAGYMATRLAAVLVLAAGAAYLANSVWFAPERDALDENLEGATCGKYTGTIVKGWEQICAEQRERESK